MSKALVVDDSRAIRMILRKILIGVGYEVCEAGNGVEALEVLGRESGTIGLVLADWNMPKMNGLELVKELRQRIDSASLKVVMVTTEAELSHMQSALQAGADEYVMKPFTVDILIEKLALIDALPEVSV